MAYCMVAWWHGGMAASHGFSWVLMGLLQIIRKYGEELASSGGHGVTRVGSNTGIIRSSKGTTRDYCTLNTLPSEQCAEETDAVAHGSSTDSRCADCRQVLLASPVLGPLAHGSARRGTQENFGEGD
jgi:hypothetical protein